MDAGMQLDEERRLAIQRCLASEGPTTIAASLGWSRQRYGGTCYFLWNSFPVERNTGLLRNPKEFLVGLRGQ